MDVDRRHVVLLADLGTSVQRFVSVFVGIYIILILVYVLLSWVPLGASGTVERLRSALREVCEPYLRLFRRIIPPLGPIDLSPIVAIVSLTVGERVVNAVIGKVT